MVENWIQNDMKVSQSLYKGSEHGFRASNFHSRCDGKVTNFSLVSVAWFLMEFSLKFHRVPAREVTEPRQFHGTLCKLSGAPPPYSRGPSANFAGSLRQIHGDPPRSDRTPRHLTSPKFCGIFAGAHDICGDPKLYGNLQKKWSIFHLFDGYNLDAQSIKLNFNVHFK